MTTESKKPESKQEKPSAPKKPKAHKTSPVHTMADSAEVEVPAGTLRELGLAETLKIAKEVPNNRPTAVKVSALRKAGFADKRKSESEE